MYLSRGTYMCAGLCTPDIGHWKILLDLSMRGQHGLFSIPLSSVNSTQ
jgi:hypothetical protein